MAGFKRLNKFQVSQTHELAELRRLVAGVSPKGSRLRC